MLRRQYRWTELGLLLLPAIFLLLALLELEVTNAALSSQLTVSRDTLPPLYAFTPALGLIAALVGTHVLLSILVPDADQTLLPIAGTLSGVGVIMALRLGPVYGQDDLGIKQLVWVIIGLGACVFTVWITRDLRWVRNYKYTWAAVGLGLVGITFVNAVRNFNTNAPSRDVLTIGSGGFSFQPSELVKICLVVFFAAYLNENREILAQGGIPFGPFNLPPLKHLGPLLVMLGLALLIAVGIRELGLAVLIFGLFLSLLYIASNRLSYILGGLLLFGFGAYLGFHIFSYARSRLEVVSTAFDPGVASTSGYQIVQGLIAFGAGGVFGSGLGLGHPNFVPAATTDYVAAAFAEEFGLAGVLALLGLFMLLIYRGMLVAAKAAEPFNQLLAAGLTAVFALQALVILAGNLKIMPLTGIPLPFVAYGGSATIANFIIIGLLIRLSSSSST
jgi:cell division protein FtsW (lipid II flippase)